MLILWTTELPHIICLTEHHLCDYEINSTSTKYCNLGAKYCRKSRTNGGISIFIHETLLFTIVELNEFCKDQDLEVCAVKLLIPPFVFCVFIGLLLEIFHIS